MPFHASSKARALLAAGGGALALLGLTHATCPAVRQNPQYCPLAPGPPTAAPPPAVSLKVV